MGQLCKSAEDKLIKSGRKWAECDYIPYRYAELFCEKCGNIVEMVNDSGVNPVCCGQKMTKIEAGTVEASREKHIPAVVVEGNTVKAIVVKDCALPRKQVDKLCEEVQVQAGQKPYWFKVDENGELVEVEAVLKDPAKMYGGKK